jgi:cysteine desulfurase
MQISRFKNLKNIRYIKNSTYPINQFPNNFINKSKINKNFSTNLNNENCIKQNSIKNSENDINNQHININIEKSENKFLKKSNVLFFDFQSTTPIDPRVLDAMLPYMTYLYGNPHSKSHEYGWSAEDAVEISRKVNFNKIKY